METKLQSFSSISQLIPSLPAYHNPLKTPSFTYRIKTSRSASPRAASCLSKHRERRLTSVDSKYRYDKAIPEQIIEKPVDLSVFEKEIGEQPRCDDCQAKGAVVCVTCGGSGLYVDSILECQGIIVKVRCLGCGGTGNIMCSECGGRGHI